MEFFAPIQVAAIMALRTPEDVVAENVNIYRKRRDVLVDGLNRMGWKVTKTASLNVRLGTNP